MTVTTKSEKVNAFNFIRKGEKMSKVMDLLIERKWSDKRIAHFMALIAEQRNQTTRYTPTYIQGHKNFRANQAKVKALKKVKVA